MVRWYGHPIVAMSAARTGADRRAERRRKPGQVGVEAGAPDDGRRAGQRAGVGDRHTISDADDSAPTADTGIVETVASGTQTATRRASRTVSFPM